MTQEDPSATLEPDAEQSSGKKKKKVSSTASSFEFRKWRLDLMLEKGYDPVMRRIIPGVQFIEHNQENDVAFPLTANILSALDALEYQYFTPPGLEKREHIEIILKTLGGDAYEMQAIHDRIEMCEVPVHIYIFGACMSAGTVILQAATKRFITRNSHLMLHYGTSYYEGSSHPESLKQFFLHEDEIIEYMVEAYLSRMNKGELIKDGIAHFKKKWGPVALLGEPHVEAFLSGLDKEKFVREVLADLILSKDTYINAKDAVRLGLVDEIKWPSIPANDPFTAIVASA